MQTDDRSTSEKLTVLSEAKATGFAVWEALTVGREQWWPEMQFDPVVGSPVRETWFENGKERSAVGQVIEVDPGRVLSFDWRELAWPAPLRVRFSIEDEGDRCKVAVTESGFESLANGTALRTEHQAGWSYHLARLCRQAER